MRVLVLGGSGVVGAAAAAALQRHGADVIVGSRSGQAPVGRPRRLDVRQRGLGLGSEAKALAGELTHIVSCFGSVDLDASPTAAVETHLHGTRNLLAFAASCPRLERLVHVSSVLVFGRAQGRLSNRELDLGQGFRSWYDYGKFLAEATVRGERSVSWRVVRLGPILGADGPVTPSARTGLPSILPFMLRGYPVHLPQLGRFPCYVGDSLGAAEVLAQACLNDGAGETWTWFDSTRPTLAETLTGLCSAWNVIPRIVELPIAGRLARLAHRRLGVPETLLSYGEPWVDIDPAVLADLPFEPPACADGYILRTSAALRERPSELAA